jgi:NADPH:quinone reductase-like Zn-dependent oxidoreductase
MVNCGKTTHWGRPATTSFWTPRREGLDDISRMVETRRLSAVIDGPYPFDRIPWAIERFGRAQHIGKIVITVA